MTKEVDWKLVYEFCARNRLRFEEEDQKTLKRTIRVMLISLFSGVTAGVASRYLLFKLPIVQSSSGVLRFNLSIGCLSIPPLVTIVLAQNYLLKPTYLSIAEKYMSRGMQMDD